MSKKEEKAKEYAEENSWYPGETSYESDNVAMQESFADAYKAGWHAAMKYLYKLPLDEAIKEISNEIKND